MVVAIAEQLLARSARTALDVGCGEGLWRAALRRAEPRIEYTGIDPSAYAVRRYGGRRNILQGDISSLDALDLPRSFDVIVCNDVLHYVNAPALYAGMSELATRLRGVAYLGLFTSADDIEGDLHTFRRRSPAFYRNAFARAGLRPIGMHCWVPAALAKNLAALELSDA